MVDPVTMPVAPVSERLMVEVSESGSVAAADAQRFDRALQCNGHASRPILNVGGAGHATRIADESVTMDSLVHRDTHEARLGERVIEAFDKLSCDYNEWTSYVNKMVNRGDVSNRYGRSSAQDGGAVVGGGASGIVTDPNQRIDAQIYRPDLGEPSLDGIGRNSLAELEAAHMRMLNETRVLSAESNRFMILTAKLNLATAGISKMLGSFATLMKNQ